MQSPLHGSEPPTIAQPTTSEASIPRETPTEERPAPPLHPGTGKTIPDLLHAYRHDRYRFVAEMGIQAGRALAWAHRQNVVHRDIKPSNLMVDRHHHLYVVDFGLTRALLANAETSLPGNVRGTPWYMSPEQARGQDVDGRSDIYSLGVTLYELASGGSGPYRASRNDSQAVLEQVKTGQTLPLHVFAPDVPPALEHIIQRAMHADPAQRYSSADALVADLEALTRVVEPPHASIPAPAAPPSRPALPLRRWLASGAVFIALLMGAVWLTRKSLEPKANPTPPPANPPAPDAPLDMPAILIDRPQKLPIALLKQDLEPLWHRRLLGEGKYSVLPPGDALCLYSPLDKPLTLLALDDDPRRHWFEFTVEVKPVLNSPPERNELGIFWGWRHDPADPDRRYRFFLAQLLPPAGAAPARLKVFSAVIGEPRGDRAAVFDLRPLPNGEIVLPPLPAGSNGWHPLKVHAMHTLVTVTVDHQAPVEFDLDKLKKHQANEDGSLDARGALGIWTNNGPGFFRGATVTALPAAVKLPPPVGTPPE